MIKDTYHSMPSKGHTRFAFQSEGEKGIIVKIVEFYFIEDNTWNLGFGDWKRGIVDDTVISSNQDSMKIIRTVASITLDFFKVYSKSTVRIKPVDDKRKRFYNLIFQRYYDTILPTFYVIGIIDKQKETYKPEKFYDSFEIFLKFEL